MLRSFHSWGYDSPEYFRRGKTKAPVTCPKISGELARHNPELVKVPSSGQLQARGHLGFALTTADS